jgi:hypothetical protein
MSQAFSQTAEDVSLEDVTYDVATVLTSLEIGKTHTGNCSEQDLSVSSTPPKYNCHCDTKTVQGKKLIPLAANHPLKKKYNIQLLSVGSTFKVVNDNHLGHFMGMPGDDYGNTFGGDVGVFANLKVKENQKKIRVGVNYRMRQYTKPIKGYTSLDFENNQVNVYGKDENNNNVHIGSYDRDMNSEDFSKDWNRNQASLTLRVLDVDLLINKPAFKGKGSLDYGLALGVKELSDNANQKGASMQDSHHTNAGIYRFEWDTFSNLLVGGSHKFLTVEPIVQVNLPTIDLFGGVCRINSSARASLLFNNSFTPNRTPSSTLNLLEPKAQVDFSLGLIPLKGEKKKSVIEFGGGFKYDPKNKTPMNADPGAQGTARGGLKINGKIGKRINFYIIPIEFYAPIGKTDNNILSAESFMVGDQVIQADILTQDVIGSWGEIGVVIKLGKLK